MNGATNTATAARARLVAVLERAGYKALGGVPDAGLFAGPFGAVTVPRKAVCGVAHDRAALVLISTIVTTLAPLLGRPVADLHREVLCGT